MTYKLKEAVKTIVEELNSMSPEELMSAIKDLTKLEYSQAVDLLHMLSSTVIHKRTLHQDDGDTLVLFIPKEVDSSVPIVQEPSCSQDLLKLIQVLPLDLGEWVKIKDNLYHAKCDTQQLLYFKDGCYYVQFASVYYLSNLNLIQPVPY